MKFQIVFATRNPHKIVEINQLIGDEIEILSLDDIGYAKDLPETRETFEGNAIQKAETLEYDMEVDCFSEDTGLEIVALGGSPGVTTARYAGPEKNPEKNIDKVLTELKDKEDRSAQFRTVIALMIDRATFCFEGITTGKISDHPRGDKGFGYDPIFVPDGYERTFAEMDLKEKSVISHRARAVRKLIAFLENYLKRKNPELPEPQR